MICRTLGSKVKLACNVQSSHLISNGFCCCCFEIKANFQTLAFKCLSLTYAWTSSGSGCLVITLSETSLSPKICCLLLSLELLSGTIASSLLHSASFKAMFVFTFPDLSCPRELLRSLSWPSSFLVVRGIHTFLNLEDVSLLWSTTEKDSYLRLKLYCSKERDIFKDLRIMWLQNYPLLKFILRLWEDWLARGESLFYYSSHPLSRGYKRLVWYWCVAHRFKQSLWRIYQRIRYTTANSLCFHECCYYSKPIV